MLSSEARGTLVNKRDKSITVSTVLCNLGGTRAPFTLGLLRMYSIGRNIIQIIEASYLTGVILGHVVS